LPSITPNFLDFQILSCSTEKIQKNTLIEYKLKIHKIPIRWKTLIKDFQQNKFFSDVQTQGAYQVWFHQHFFHPVKVAGRLGVLLEDKIFYRIPFMPFSYFALAFVRKDIRKIFSYRNGAIRKKFLTNPN
jgi:hypothetical protein